MECNEKGYLTDTLYLWEFDTVGRLIKSITYSNNKRLSTTFYTYNYKNQADSIYFQFSNQPKYLKQFNKFDESGRLINYYRCFEKEGCKIFESYDYNNDGLLVKKKEYKNEISDTEYYYEYDNKGNRIKITTKFYSGTTLKQLNFYDSNGLQIKSVSYTPSGTKNDSTTYEYDVHGNLIYINWMGGLNTKSRYKYDKLGNNIEYKSTSLNGQLMNHRKMEYDGRLIKIRKHYKETQIHKCFRYKYIMYK